MKEVDEIQKKTELASTPSAEEVDASQYFKLRSRMIDDLKAQGVEIYPHKFQVSIRLNEFYEKYKSLKEGEHLYEVEVKVAGRLMRIAESGQNLRFFDLVENDTKIQIMASKKYHQGNDENDFSFVYKRFRRGDIVGVRGFPGKSKRGELSIFSYETVLLSPCYYMLPTAISGLKSQEVRYRQRYLDLLINPVSKQVFVARSKIIKTIRDYLEQRDFIEVETPMMNLIPGGATAKPFITHHNELDLDLYMRIATELYLKQLVVGGLDRVFEIGKNFRNEGIDLTHNPEFTAVEFYMAYADYYDLCRMTEEIMGLIAQNVCGSYLVQYQPDAKSEVVHTIDFTPPFKRVSYIDEIEKQSGVTLPRPFDSQECIDTMIKILRDHNVDLPVPQTPGKLLDKLCGHFIEDHIINPTFIIDYPEILSPLAKYHRSKPELTERCELFVCGKEVANFYTELNDPFHQRKCFMDQAKAKSQGDDEACDIDESFCTALEYGLPPTGGCGFGIDRLVMIFTNKNNIKEVILFPAMRTVGQTQQKQL